MIQQRGETLRDKHARAASEWNTHDDSVLLEIEDARLPPIELLTELNASLRSANRRKLRSFVQKRGVQVLLDTIRNRLKSRPQMDLDAAVQTEVIKCLKSVMNNIEGMNAIMHHRGALELIAFCLNFDWQPLAVLVMEILTVASVTSEEGCSQVSSPLEIYMCMVDTQMNLWPWLHIMSDTCGARTFSEPTWRGSFVSACRRFPARE